MTQLVRKIRSLRLSPNSLPVVLFILGILAYGIHLPWMGFYWDDWPWIWSAQVLGSGRLFQIDIGHRPLTGLVLWVGELLSGDNAFIWQIYSFIFRLLGAVILAWSLKKLWPRQKGQIIWVTLLFLIYPGFSQQFVAVNSSRHLFPLMTFFASIGFMIKAHQGKARYWGFTGLALVFAIITMLTTEYYYGLEFIRPVILWILNRNREEKPSRSPVLVLKAWLPYLMIALVIFTWRYSVSQNINYKITVFEEISSSSYRGVAELLRSALGDIAETGLGVWGRLFAIPDPVLFGPRTRLYYWGLVAVSVISIFLYLLLIQPDHRETRWGREAIVLGVISLMVAPIPFWTTGLDPGFGFPADRLTLPMMFGASLLLVGILELILKFRPAKVFVLSLIIGFAVGQHYQNGISYRRDWQQQVKFFRQLTLRIPGLEPNTAILSNELPSRSTDNSLSAPLNWIYDTNISTEQLPFYMFYIDLRFTNKGIQFDQPITLSKNYVFSSFNSTTEHAIVLYYKLPGCLRVLNESYHQYDPSLPLEVKEALPLSNFEQILSLDHPSIKMPPPLTKEPSTMDWCYYFEKADLARQRGEWSQVANFSDQALKVGFDDSTAKHASEYELFIHGYAHTEQWEKAHNLTVDAFTIDPTLGPMLCDAWNRFESETPVSAERTDAFKEVNNALGCTLD